MRTRKIGVWWKRGAAAAALLVFTAATVQFTPAGKTLYLKLKVFGDVLDRIQADYLENKEPESLVNNAIRGMVSGLDPHTTYFTREQFERWSQDFEGYPGIGIFFDIIDGALTVISVINESPAAKVGLQIGDRITAIDGESAVGIKRDDVPLRLMGPSGTKVTLIVARKGWARPKRFSIVREEVRVESVANAFMIKPQTGYIGISRFTSTTEEELDRALQKLELMGLKSLVLDLRQNGGGYLEAAVRVAEKFLPRGRMVVYTRGRIDDANREYVSGGKWPHPRMPLVLLIDRTTASASEILAGALQDWDRALVVGELSFGKGLVQTPYRFSDGSALLMTTARYHTPSGRTIQRAYGDKSAEEYYDEVFDEKWRMREEELEGRPVFKSMTLGRPLKGGGGIVPDVFFQSKPDTLGRTVRTLVDSPKRPIFTFVENYAASHPGLKDNAQVDFLRNFRFSDADLAAFRRHARAQGASMAPADWERSKEDIRFLLKQTLAEKIWGGGTGFKVQVYRDRRLIEALSLMDRAEAMLNAAYPPGVLP